MKDFEINISPDCVSEEMDSQAIILNIKTGMYHELNQTGTIIWNEIKAEKIKKSVLVTRLNNKFNRNDLEDDINDFLERMLEKKIILVEEI